MYEKKREKATKRKGKFIAIGHVEEKFYELRQEWGGGALIVMLPFAFLFLEGTKDKHTRRWKCNGRKAKRKVEL